MNFAAACLGMLVYGIVLTSLGSLLPSLISRFGLDRAAAGSLFALMSLGILAGSLVFGPVVDRYGYKGLLTACLALIMVGLEGLAFAPTHALLVTSILLIGFGGGVVNGGANALVADISAERRGARLALVSVFFGLGALGMPFVLGVFLDSMSYSTIVAGIGALVVGPVVYCAAIRFPEPKQPRGLPLTYGLHLLRDRTLLLLGVVLLFESGIEITAGGWMAAYVHEVLAYPADRALFFISLYWAGMTVARLVLGAVLQRVSPVPVLFASAGTALVAALIIIASTSIAVAAVGSFLLGAGFAAVFPIVFALVAERYAELSGTALSVVIVMALVGGTTAPWLAGVLGDAAGLRVAFGLIPVGLIAMTLVFAAARRGLRADPSP
jgi:FHS family glucose/mannose:H+ symporter-like MFS transporter